MNIIKLYTHFIYTCIHIFEYINPSNINLATVQKLSLSLYFLTALFFMYKYFQFPKPLSEIYLLTLYKSSGHSTITRYIQILECHFVGLNYSWYSRKLSLIFSLLSFLCSFPSSKFLFIFFYLVAVKHLIIDPLMQNNSMLSQRGLHSVCA